MTLPAIAGYTACCGSSIVYGFFTSDPREPSGYKLDNSGWGYAMDKDGNKIPVTFAEKFQADMKREMTAKRSYMWSCILTEQQLKQFDGAWMKILHDTGFVPTHRWCNYNHGENQFLHLFVLIADEKGKCKDDFSAPPKGWDKLSEEDAKPASLIDAVKAAVLPKTSGGRKATALKAVS